MLDVILSDHLTTVELGRELGLDPNDALEVLMVRRHGVDKI